jgi:hypothetical protein
MEEKDVSSIANAVSIALAKLNADTAKEATDKRSDNKGESNESEAEVFKCPDCGVQVKGGISFCQGCGCPLEWGV